MTYDRDENKVLRISVHGCSISFKKKQDEEEKEKKNTKKLK